MEVEALATLLSDKIDAEVFDAGSNLKIVSQLAVGFDNIDVAECTKRGIPVGNTPGVLTDTTADLAWALLMSGARRIVEGMDYVRAGKWKTWGPMLLMGQDVCGATLGIIGLGRIGAAVAKRATGFDMRILYYDVRRREDLEAEWGLEYVDLDTLLRIARFASQGMTICPLGDAFCEPIRSYLNHFRHEFEAAIEQAKPLPPAKQPSLPVRSGRGLFGN